MSPWVRASRHTQRAYRGDRRADRHSGARLSRRDRGADGRQPQAQARLGGFLLPLGRPPRPAGRQSDGQDRHRVLLDDRGYVGLLKMYLARAGYTCGPVFRASINARNSFYQQGWSERDSGRGAGEEDWYANVSSHGRASALCRAWEEHEQPADPLGHAVHDLRGRRDSIVFACHAPAGHRPHRAGTPRRGAAGGDVRLFLTPSR